MKKSLIALAFGTLGLGIAEFTMMGILSYVATDLGISIPVAGHFISAYALGVCFGAPMLLLARKRPLKQILLVLMALMIVGNICASMAPNYWVLLLGRFVSGLPHGAYFGVASIVAGKLADKGKSSEAVSIMIAGMTVANLFGVPLGTSLSHTLSWRATFLLVGAWGLITLYYIWRWVPQVEGLKDTGFKGQFRFLKKPAPWLILGATALGNGGVFCWYSYITPLLTEVSGFSAESITALMVLAGFGMVAGNLVSGRMSDRYTPGEGRHGGARDDMCYFIIDIFTLAPSVVFGNIDDALYGRFVCRLQSGAGVDDSCGSWRRNVGRRLCADGFQFWECYRSLYRRPCLEWRIPLSCIGRRAVCTDGIYFIPCLLQEISGEVLSVSFFLCMFVHKY